MGVTSKDPGWDACAIKDIANEEFGGYREMFEHFGWPERGSEMLPQFQSRVAGHFGSIEKFVEHYTTERRE